MKIISLKQVKMVFILCGLWILFLALFAPRPFWALRPHLHDHISNLHVPLLALHHGAKIYTSPIEETLTRDTSLLAKETADKWGWGQEEMYHLPERSNDKPLMFVWGNLPRPYPPGIFIILAPFTYLMELTGGFSEPILFILTVFFCLTAHIVFFQFLNACQQTYNEQRYPWYLKLIFVAIYFEMIGWSLSGQYEALGLLFLIPSLLSINQKRYLNSILFFCMAVFIHFRGILWAIPLMFIWLKNIDLIIKDFRELSLSQKFGALILLVLGLIAGVVFTKISGPLLYSTPITNTFAQNLMSGHWHLQQWLFAISTSIFVYFFIKKKETLILLTLLNMVLLFTKSIILRAWYAPYLFPLMFAFLPSKDQLNSIKMRFLVIVCLGSFYLDSTPTEFYFVKQVGKLVRAKLEQL